MFNNQWPRMSGYRRNFMNHQMEQGSHYYGKRSAEADADAFYQPYGYSNYGSNYGSNWNNWYNNWNNNNMYGYNMFNNQWPRMSGYMNNWNRTNKTKHKTQNKTKQNKTK